MEVDWFGFVVGCWFDVVGVVCCYVVVFGVIGFWLVGVGFCCLVGFVWCCVYCVGYLFGVCWFVGWLVFF